MVADEHCPTTELSFWTNLGLILILKHCHLCFRYCVSSVTPLLFTCDSSAKLDVILEAIIIKAANDKIKE